MFIVYAAVVLSVPIHTYRTQQVKSYTNRELVFLSQKWIQGWKAAPSPPAPPGPPKPDVCSVVKKNTDQIGGGELAHYTNTSQKACCALCINNTGW